MQRKHASNRALWLALLTGAAGLLAYSAPGRAQEQKFAPSKDLYAGGSMEVEGVKLAGWGSGMAAEDRTYKTGGDNSIKVDTSGYYAGGRIVFEEPKDITEQKNDPYGFLEFVIRFQQGRARPSQAANPMYPSSEGSSGDSSMGYAEMGYPGAMQAITPDTKKLKVNLICEEGTFTASNFPVTLFPAREEGWFSVAIPFVAFKGLDKPATAKVKEIRIFGDTKDTFWIGEIRTTADDEPINVDPLDEMEVSVQEAVEFTAQATGGLSPLHYSWDFDFSDGIQEDAIGPTVVHVFRQRSKDVPGQPGELQPYVVTLTVRDLSEAKKPVRRQTNVIVNP
jgi:hypothetical protein